MEVGKQRLYEPYFVNNKKVINVELSDYPSIHLFKWYEYITRTSKKEG